MRLLANGSQGPAVMPAPVAPVGTPGYAYNGDPSTSANVSTYDPDTFNVQLAELLALLSAAGISPDNTGADTQQILKALRLLFGISAVDTGAVNALAITPSPALSALTDGVLFRVRVAHTNTGEATLYVNALGTAPILSPLGVALSGGELAAGSVVFLSYNAAASAFVLIGGSPSYASASVRGVVQLATTALVQGGTDAVTAITPAALAGAMTKSLAASGYQRLPSGLIIQWGTGQNTSAGIAQTVTFPTAFPTACLEVVACEGEASNGTWGQGNPTVHGVSTITATNFSENRLIWQGSSWSGATSITYRYIAIGY